MAYENQVYVHSRETLAHVAHPGHLSDPHPLSSRGASVLHREVITNTTPRPCQKQLPGPNKEQGSRISLPTCPGYLVPHARLAKGLWEKRSHLCPPHRKEGHPALPPSLKSRGGLSRGWSSRGRGVPAGRAARSPAGRAGTSEGLVHAPDAAVQLQHPQRRHARPAAPAGPPGASPSAARPFRRSFVPPARLGLRYPGAAWPWWSLGETPQDEATPGSAGPDPPEVPVGRPGSATCALLALRGRERSRLPAETAGVRRN